MSKKAFLIFTMMFVMFIIIAGGLTYFAWLLQAGNDAAWLVLGVVGTLVIIIFVKITDWVGDYLKSRGSHVRTMRDRLRDLQQESRTRQQFLREGREVQRGLVPGGGAAGNLNLNDMIAPSFFDAPENSYSAVDDEY